MTRLSIRPRVLFVILTAVLFIATFVIAGRALAQTPLTLVVNANTGTIDTGDTCPTARDSAIYLHPQAAVNCAEPGDTVEVDPGTYQSNHFTDTPPHFSANDQYAPPLIVWQDDLTIKAMDGSGTAGDGSGDVIIEVTHDVWSNPVAIQAATGGTWNGSPYVDAGVYPTNGTAPNAVDIIASGITFAGFTLHNAVPGAQARNQAIFIGGLYPGDIQFAARPVANNIVRSNYVLDSGFHNGVYVWQSDGSLVEGNTVPNPVELGIRLYDGTVDSDTLINASDGTVFRDNTTKYIQAFSNYPGNADNVHLNTIVEGNEVQAIAIRAGRYEGLRIKGNTVHDEIRLDWGSFDGVTISGNQVTPAWPDPGVYITHAATVVFANNVLLNGNTTGLVMEDSSGPVEIEGNTFTAIPGVAIQLVDVGGAVIAENTIENSSGYAMRLDGATNAEIYDNVFGVENFGMWITGNGGSQTNIFRNVFDTTLGLAVLGSADATRLHVNYNDFSAVHAAGDPANTDAIYNDPANAMLDGECNWFGTVEESEILSHLTGPVDYTPWLNAPPGESAGCGGVATGGGWIDDPAGKASFAFVARFNESGNGLLGNAQFVFRPDNLRFHSKRIEWLQLTGAEAQIRGEGTVNGDRAPNDALYQYIIWAGDGTGPGGADTFRIKIWWDDNGTEMVVYDNNGNQTLGGGKIKVHPGPR